jgi:hypothetical protein
MNTKMDDENLTKCLKKYIDKIENGLLTCEERINLVYFFINDPENNTPSQVDTQNEEKNMEDYLSLGWFMFNCIQKTN